MSNQSLKKIAIDKSFITHDKIIGYVFETMDYSKFDTYPSNREADHVAAIERNMINNGAIDVPIIVTESLGETKLMCVDGNNTRKARENLGLPIPYIVLDGASEREMRALNLTRKNWTKIDFVKFYASTGSPEYRLIQNFIESYPEIPIVTMEYILQDSLATERRCDKEKGKLERGVFRIANPEKSKKFLEELRLIGNVEKNDRPVYKRPQFIKAVMRLKKEAPAFSVTKLVAKIQSYPSKFFPQETAKGYADMIENLLNYNAKSDRVNFGDIIWTK